MVAVARPQRLTLKLAHAGGLAAGGLVALTFLVMPTGLLERLVAASGLPAVIAAAEPPLGFTARIALALVFGGLAAGFAWFGLKLLAGNRPMDLSAFLRRKPKGDAAPRAPLSATRELGTPFLQVKAKVLPVEQDIPIDLDQPIGAYDPSALRAEPLPVPEPVAALAQIPERPQLIDPGDRFETFELTPALRAMPAPPPVVAPEPIPASMPVEEAVVAPITETTVNALLARLERGIAQRAAPVVEPAPAVTPEPISEPETAPPPPTIRAGSLEDTLGDLRRMATGTR